MEKHNLVKEVEILIVARKIRFLGLIILFGVFLIFASGIFVSSTNINPHLEYLNISTFVFCLACCGFSVLLKKLLLKKVTNEKFEASYFNAHVLPFALCDLGGLLCITTSLFVNQNLIYASAGFLVMIGAVIYNFPRFDDHKRIIK
ncbi:MAG: hypothetical protein WC644_06745 [Ignavibacteria bacterium]